MPLNNIRKYRKGRTFEYQVMGLLRKHNFILITRSAASHSPIDIVAMPEPNVIWLIQCKVNAKDLKPHKVKELLALAPEGSNIKPVLAFRHSRKHGVGRPHRLVRVVDLYTRRDLLTGETRYLEEKYLRQLVKKVLA